MILKKGCFNMLRKFFALNRKLCEILEHYLLHKRENIFSLYEKLVAQYVNSRYKQIVIDIGGGKTCSFAKYKNPDMMPTIVAVDISAEEMRNNCDVDEKRVANIMQGIPWGDEGADLLVSRSTLEHFETLHNFIIESKRVLKKNGYFIHLFPSKFTPFAIANQMLPKKLSKKLLHLLRPESKGISGFPAFYDKCYYSAFKSLLEKNGFEIVDIHLSYYQSSYYHFFLPLFLVSAIYDIILEAIGAKNLCAYLLVVATKK